MELAIKVGGAKFNIVADAGEAPATFDQVPDVPSLPIRPDGVGPAVPARDQVTLVLGLIASRLKALVENLEHLIAETVDDLAEEALMRAGS